MDTKGFKRLISIGISIIFFLNSTIIASPTVFYDNSFGSIYGAKPSLFIPESYGNIEKSKILNNQPQVILIKDAHCNYEAQTNIAKILEILIRDFKVDLVCVEGASGLVDTSIFGGYPDQKVREKTADRYVKKGYLSASEALSIGRAEGLPFTIYGIEDTRLYLENFKGFRNTMTNKEETGRFIAIVINILNQLKNRIYNGKLLGFDKKAAEYSGNKVTLADWVEYLGSQGPVTRGQKNLNLVLKSIKIEDKIDFKAVERERESLIKKLEKQLTKEDLKGLIEKSLLFKLGKISSLDYYSYLEQYLALFSFKDLHNLRSYIHLVKLQSRVDGDGLFSEIEEIEYSIREGLYQNKIERDLDETAKIINVLNKLYNLNLTRKELEYYKNNKIKFAPSQILPFILIQARANNITIPPELEDKDFLDKVTQFIQPAEYFYEKALERDDVLVNNLLERMERDNENTAVMVVGGFHADGIIQRFEEKAVSYSIIIPKITRAQEDSPYMSIMMDKSIDIDKAIGSLGINNLSPALVLSELGRLLYGWVASGIAKDEIGNKTIDQLLRGQKDVDRERISALFKLAGIDITKKTLEDVLGDIFTGENSAEALRSRIVGERDDLRASFLIEMLRTALTVEKKSEDEINKYINGVKLQRRIIEGAMFEKPSGVPVQLDSLEPGTIMLDVGRNMGGDENAVILDHHQLGSERVTSAAGLCVDKRGKIKALMQNFKKVVVHEDPDQDAITAVYMVYRILSGEELTENEIAFARYIEKYDNAISDYGLSIERIHEDVSILFGGLLASVKSDFMSAKGLKPWEIRELSPEDKTALWKDMLGAGLRFIELLMKEDFNTDKEKGLLRREGIRNPQFLELYDKAHASVKEDIDKFKADHKSAETVPGVRVTNTNDGSEVKIPVCLSTNTQSAEFFAYLYSLGIGAGVIYKDKEHGDRVVIAVNPNSNISLESLQKRLNRAAEEKAQRLGIPLGKDRQGNPEKFYYKLVSNGTLIITTSGAILTQDELGGILKGEEIVVQSPKIEMGGQTTILPLEYPRTLQPLTIKEGVDNGVAYTPKSKFHITIIGFGHTFLNTVKTASELTDKGEIQVRAEEILREAIKGLTFKVRLTGEYRVVKKQYQNEAEPRRTIIEMVQVDGLEKFYQRLETTLGVTISRIPPHISLFTSGDPMGIGLNSQKDLDDLSRQMTPEERGVINGAILPKTISEEPAEVEVPAIYEADINRILVIQDALDKGEGVEGVGQEEIDKVRAMNLSSELPRMIAQIEEANRMPPSERVKRLEKIYRKETILFTITIQKMAGLAHDDPARQTALERVKELQKKKGPAFEEKQKEFDEISRIRDSTLQYLLLLNTYQVDPSLYVAVFDYRMSHMSDEISRGNTDRLIEELIEKVLRMFIQRYGLSDLEDIATARIFVQGIFERFEDQTYDSFVTRFLDTHTTKSQFLGSLLEIGELLSSLHRRQRGLPGKGVPLRDELKTGGNCVFTFLSSSISQYGDVIFQLDPRKLDEIDDKEAAKGEEGSGRAWYYPDDIPWGIPKNSQQKVILPSQKFSETMNRRDARRYMSAAIAFHFVSEFTDTLPAGFTRRLQIGPQQIESFIMNHTGLGTVDSIGKPEGHWPYPIPLLEAIQSIQVPSEKIPAIEAEIERLAQGQDELGNPEKATQLRALKGKIVPYEGEIGETERARLYVGRLSIGDPIGSFLSKRREAGLIVRASDSEVVIDKEGVDMEVIRQYFSTRYGGVWTVEGSKLIAPKEVLLEIGDLAREVEIAVSYYLVGKAALDTLLRAKVPEQAGKVYFTVDPNVLINLGMTKEDVSGESGDEFKMIGFEALLDRLTRERPILGGRSILGFLLPGIAVSETMLSNFRQINERILQIKDKGIQNLTALRLAIFLTGAPADLRARIINGLFKKEKDREPVNNLLDNSDFVGSITKKPLSTDEVVEAVDRIVSILSPLSPKKEGVQAGGFDLREFKKQLGMGLGLYKDVKGRVMQAAGNKPITEDMLGGVKVSDELKTAIRSYNASLAPAPQEPVPEAAAVVSPPVPVIQLPSIPVDSILGKISKVDSERMDIKEHLTDLKIGQLMARRMHLYKLLQSYQERIRSQEGIPPRVLEVIENLITRINRIDHQINFRVSIITGQTTEGYEWEQNNIEDLLPLIEPGKPVIIAGFNPGGLDSRSNIKTTIVDDKEGRGLVQKIQYHDGRVVYVINPYFGALYATTSELVLGLISDPAFRKEDISRIPFIVNRKNVDVVVTKYILENIERFTGEKDEETLVLENALLQIAQMSMNNNIQVLTDGRMGWLNTFDLSRMPEAVRTQFRKALAIYFAVNGMVAGTIAFRNLKDAVDLIPELLSSYSESTGDFQGREDLQRYYDSTRQFVYRNKDISSAGTWKEKEGDVIVLEVKDSTHTLSVVDELTLRERETPDLTSAMVVIKNQRDPKTGRNFVEVVFRPDRASSFEGFDLKDSLERIKKREVLRRIQRWMQDKAKEVRADSEMGRILLSIIDKLNTDFRTVTEGEVTRDMFALLRNRIKELTSRIDTLIKTKGAETEIEAVRKDLAQLKTLELDVDKIQAEVSANNWGGATYRAFGSPFPARGGYSALGMDEIASIVNSDIERQRQERMEFQQAIQDLQSDKREERAEAVRVLSRFKKYESVRHLLPLIQDRSGLVRKELAITLGFLGFKDAIPYLVDYLNDSDGQVRWMAALSLSRFKDEKIILLMLKARFSKWKVKEKITERELAIQREGFLLASVINSRYNYPQLRDVLVDALQSSDPYIRSLAIMNLGRLKDAGLIDLLKSFLSDEALSVRDSVIEAFYSIGGSEVKEILANYIYSEKEKDPYVLVHAQNRYNAMAGITPEVPSVLLPVDEGLRDRFVGAFLGGAIGDVLGAPVEGVRPTEFLELFGTRVIEGYLDPTLTRGKDFPHGQYTDDTEIALALVDTLIQDGNFDPHHIGEAFGRLVSAIDQRERPNYGYGIGTLMAGRRLSAGVNWRLSGDPLRAKAGPGVGAVMRVASIGLINVGNLSRMSEEARLQSLMTHTHPISQAASVVVAFIINKILTMTDDEKLLLIRDDIQKALLVQNAIDFIKEFSPDFAEELRALIQLLDKEPSDVVTRYGRGGAVAVVVLPLFFFLRNPDDFKKSIMEAINVGGDTDTIASILGSISGAFNGASKIPADLKDIVLEKKRIEKAGSDLYDFYRMRESARLHGTVNLIRGQDISGVVLQRAPGERLVAMGFTPLGVESAEGVFETDSHNRRTEGETTTSVTIEKLRIFGRADRVIIDFPGHPDRYIAAAIALGDLPNEGDNLEKAKAIAYYNEFLRDDRVPDAWKVYAREALLVIRAIIEQDFQNGASVRKTIKAIARYIQTGDFSGYREIFNSLQAKAESDLSAARKFFRQETDSLVAWIRPDDLADLEHDAAYEAAHDTAKASGQPEAHIVIRTSKFTPRGGTEHEMFLIGKNPSITDPYIDLRGIFKVLTKLAIGKAMGQGIEIQKDDYGGSEEVGGSFFAYDPYLSEAEVASLVDEYLKTLQKATVLARSGQKAEARQMLAEYYNRLTAERDIAIDLNEPIRDRPGQPSFQKWLEDYIERQSGFTQVIEVSPDSRGFDGLPNDDYTDGIRTAFIRGGFASVGINPANGQFEQLDFPLDTDVTNNAGQTRNREVIAIDSQSIRLTTEQLGVLNNIISLIGIQKELEDITLIFIYGQRAHYGVGRGQIYLDIGLLTNPREFRRQLAHELIERTDVIDGLSGDLMVELRQRATNPLDRTRALKDAIEGLARKSHDRIRGLEQHMDSLDDTEFARAMAEYLNRDRRVIERTAQDILDIINRILGKVVMADKERIVQVLSRTSTEVPITLADILSVIPEEVDMQRLIALGDEISRLKSLQVLLGEDVLQQGGQLVLSILREIVREMGIVIGGEEDPELEFRRMLNEKLGIVDAESKSIFELIKQLLHILEYDPILGKTKVDTNFYDLINKIAEIAGISNTALLQAVGRGTLRYQLGKKLEKLGKDDRETIIDRINKLIGRKGPIKGIVGEMDEDLIRLLRAKGLWNDFENLVRLMDNLEEKKVEAEDNLDSPFFDLVKQLEFYRNLAENKEVPTGLYSHGAVQGIIQNTDFSNAPVATSDISQVGREQVSRFSEANVLRGYFQRFSDNIGSSQHVVNIPYQAVFPELDVLIAEVIRTGNTKVAIRYFAGLRAATNANPNLRVLLQSPDAEIKGLDKIKGMEGVRTYRDLVERLIQLAELDKKVFTGGVVDSSTQLQKEQETILAKQNVYGLSTLQAGNIVFFTLNTELDTSKITDEMKVNRIKVFAIDAKSLVPALILGSAAGTNPVFVGNELSAPLKEVLTNLNPANIESILEQIKQGNFFIKLMVTTEELLKGYQLRRATIDIAA